MFGLGTIINTAAIILGGLAGHFFGRLLKERHQTSLTMACGISVLFIGIAGAMQGMLTIHDGPGDELSFLDRLHPDFLRGAEPGVGEEDQGRKHASRSRACRYRGVYSCVTRSFPL